MLEMPEEPSGISSCPCFRCLFEKPIDEGKCKPERCDLLDFWLNDKAFLWDKYFPSWIAKIKLPIVEKQDENEALDDESQKYRLF